MPSVSSKQERFMQIAAHDPKFANKAGIASSVAKEFEEADKNKKNKSRLSKLYKDHN